MNHYSVIIKADGHLVKAKIFARNILKANRMAEAMFSEFLDACDYSASIRLLCH